MSSNLSEFIQDNLVSTNDDEAKAVSELLEILFDEEIQIECPASVQPLGE